MKSAQKENILISWFLWQFIETPGFLFSVWNNYINFAANLFSTTFLLKTFFAPWRKYNWRYPKSFDVVEFLNTLISNIFSRFLGALMRTVLIITGFLFQAFIAIAGLIIFLGWLIAPFLVIFGIIFFLFF
jgi:hypothetical protein